VKLLIRGLLLVLIIGLAIRGALLLADEVRRGLIMSRGPIE
jgi:hypothetical protein